MPAWMKMVGIVDGVLIAAVTALGQAVPAWSADTQIAVQILGVIGTICGGTHLISARRAARAAAEKAKVGS